MMTLTPLQSLLLAGSAIDEDLKASKTVLNDIFYHILLFNVMKLIRFFN